MAKRNNTEETQYIYSSSESWCTVTPVSGSNDGQFTISVTENMDTEKSRTAYISVTSTNPQIVDKVITVVQRAQGSNTLFDELL